MADHKKKSLKIQNSLRALNETLLHSIVELICDYGKVTDDDPNIYEIEIPEHEIFHLPDVGWVGGKISLDVSYYEGTITLDAYNNSKLESKVRNIGFESIEDIRYRLFIYRLLANHYEKK